MQTRVRRLLAPALASALIGSLLAPVAVHASVAPVAAHASVAPAQPPRPGLIVQAAQRPAIREQVIAWAPLSLGTITVRRGETVVKTVRFTNLLPLTDVRIRPSLTLGAHAHGTRLRLLYTSVRQGQGLYSYFRVVTVVFAVTARADASIGVCSADLHVDARVQGRGAFRQLPNDLDFRVDVDRARVPAPHIQWTPPALGVITVVQGHTVVEKASFTSNVALTRARIVKALNDYASDRGLFVRVAAIPPRIAAHQSIPVTFAISASPHAVVRTYRDAFYVVASAYGRRVLVLPRALPFVVDVDRARIPAARIQWTPPTLGTITVQQGQTVTETASFTSNLDLSAARIVKALNDYASDRGLFVRVAPIPTSVAANTPIPVTFTITASPRAVARSYRDALYVVASANGGRVMALHYGLHFVVDVDRAPAARVLWTPPTLGTITVQQGQTVTETASFTSSLDLSAARIVKALRDYASDRGLYVQVAPVPTSIAANTPISVTFTVTAGRYAPVRTYRDALYVVGSANGGRVVALHNGFHFVVDVDRAPQPAVVWTSSSFVTYPSVASGTAVTETASFTTNVDLSNLSVVGRLVRRVRGLTITVAPLASTTVTANTPTTISFTINATDVPSRVRGGLYTGEIVLFGQPAAGASRPVLLHPTLRFDGSVN